MSFLSVPPAPGPETGPASDSFAAAEAQLFELARAPAALRRALARAAGRLVAGRVWERLGFARLGDYAVERAGVSARELRELAYVDAALAELPDVEAAFLAGRIGWAQARALCRKARPSRIAALADDTFNSDDTYKLGVVLWVEPAVRARWFFARQLANRVAGHKLSTEAFVDALTGEVLSAADFSVASEVAGGGGACPPMQHGPKLGGPNAADGAFSVAIPAALRVASPRAEREDRPPDPSGLAALVCSLPSAADLQRRAAHAPWSAPPPFVAALTDGLDCADAFELDARLRRGLRLEAQHLARVAPLLAFVVEHGLHRDLGFRSVDAYAEERLGMAASRAKALLRIERAGEVCAELRGAWREGRLSWVQAQTLLPLLLLDDATPRRLAWVDHAARVSVRRLEDDVERALGLDELDAPALAPGADGGPAGVQNGANPTLPKRNVRPKVRLFFALPPDLARLFRAVTARVPLGEMLAHALETWGAYQPRDKIPRDHLVFARDGWRCTAPACSSYRNLHGHHIVFRSAGGSDDLANLTTLCAWHHQRGVHAGRVRCTGTAPANLRFELGVRSVHQRGRVELLN